jgi:hypothetical protein
LKAPPLLRVKRFIGYNFKLFDNHVKKDHSLGRDKGRGKRRGQKPALNSLTI